MLASSTNPRQFVQRRGRVLRRSAGKDHAEIIDFLAVPAKGGDAGLDRGLLAREVARFSEFARFARNAGEALTIMRPLRETFGLLDV
jgi:superfamily II DNA or RNA helicase